MHKTVRKSIERLKGAETKEAKKKAAEILARDLREFVEILESTESTPKTN